MDLKRTAILAAAPALLWLALAAIGGLGSSEILAGVAAAAVGAVVVLRWDRAGDFVLGLLEAAEARLEGRPPDPPRRAPDDAEEADPAVVAVTDVLEVLAGELGGRRLVVWRVDRDADTVVAEYFTGDAPKRQQAAGNPLTWAAGEGSALRLDPAPRWARGDVAVAAIDHARVLSMETPPGGAPAPERLGPGARTLAAVLALADRELDVRAQRQRFRRTVAFLQGLAGERDPGLAPDALARTAMDLAGGRAAVVTSWDGAGGTVLATTGDAGPGAGGTFGADAGDVGHAARAGTVIRRAPGDGATRPLLLGPDARSDDGLYRVVVPLRHPDGAVAGVVAVWGDRAPAEQGIELLDALGPLLAIQLQRATDLESFRSRATVDELTGLMNRAAFDDRMTEAPARFHRHRRPVALMVIDLDRFKGVNDTHGHTAGDAVLRAVAETVGRAVRDVDIPARYGGEELVVLMPETMLHAAREVAERVRAAIAATSIVHEGRTIPISASIGVSACPEVVDDPAALFESADAALYAAKEAGRDRVETARNT